VLKYESAFLFFWTAVGIMTTAALSTVWLIWGFWKFDEPVSLSPVETAVLLGNAMQQGEDSVGDPTSLENLLKRFASKHIEFQHYKEKDKA
jgi:hypothetical protein